MQVLSAAFLLYTTSKPQKMFPKQLWKGMVQVASLYSRHTGAGWLTVSIWEELSKALAQPRICLPCPS